jgi:hypothetical protein
MAPSYSAKLRIMERADVVKDGKYARTAKTTSRDGKYQSVFTSRVALSKGSENKWWQKWVVAIEIEVVVVEPPSISTN